jgi:hypothetical protein
MSALQFEALKVALKQDATGYVLTVKIHPDEIPEELLRDFVGARYMVAMARINDDESPIPVKNRVQKAGMLCRHNWFHRFLEEKYEIAHANEVKATHFLHDICGIRSRTELNGNKEAQEAFDQLVNEYEEWSQQNDPF